MKILIVHLSDIHFRAGNNPAEKKFPLISKALQNEEVDLDSKALQNEEVDLDGVIVVVSGDVAYSGGWSEYEIAIKNFKLLKNELIQKTKCPEVSFICVPGNHDCNFTNTNNARETVINAIRAGVGAPVDDGTVQLCCDVQNNFFKFSEAIQIATPIKSSQRLTWETIWERGEYKLAFRCFNTAWVSEKHEKQGGAFLPRKLSQQ